MIMIWRTTEQYQPDLVCKKNVEKIILDELQFYLEIKQF